MCNQPARYWTRRWKLHINIIVCWAWSYSKLLIHLTSFFLSLNNESNALLWVEWEKAKQNCIHFSCTASGCIQKCRVPMCAIYKAIKYISASVRMLAVMRQTFRWCRINSISHCTFIRLSVNKMPIKKMQLKSILWKWITTKIQSKHASSKYKQAHSICCVPRHTHTHIKQKKMYIFVCVKSTEWNDTDKHTKPVNLFAAKANDKRTLNG